MDSVQSTPRLYNPCLNWLILFQSPPARTHHLRSSSACRISAPSWLRNSSTVCRRRRDVSVIVWRWREHDSGCFRGWGWPSLQHIKTTSATLLLRLAVESVELVLVQEPWIYNGWVCALNVFIQVTCMPRIYISFRTNINVSLHSKYSDNDTRELSGSNWLSLWTLQCLTIWVHAGRFQSKRTPFVILVNQIGYTNYLGQIGH